MLKIFASVSLDFDKKALYNEAMKMEHKESIKDVVRDFRLPRYHEIPNVGLYLEQTTKYVNSCLAPLGFDEITNSMVRNYVKMGLVANPVKKQYSEDQLAHIITIALLKQVTPLENIRELYRLQEERYSVEVAYDYFCTELENVLLHRFGYKSDLEDIGVTSTMIKEMLRSAIVAVSHIIYLNACFEGVREPEKNG